MKTGRQIWKGLKSQEESEEKEERKKNNKEERGRMIVERTKREEEPGREEGEGRQQNHVKSQLRCSIFEERARASFSRLGTLSRVLMHYVLLLLLRASSL